MRAFSCLFFSRKISLFCRAIALCRVFSCSSLRMTNVFPRVGSVVTTHSSRINFLNCALSAGVVSLDFTITVNCSTSSLPVLEARSAALMSWAVICTASSSSSSLESSSSSSLSSSSSSSFIGSGFLVFLMLFFDLGLFELEECVSMSIDDDAAAALLFLLVFFGFLSASAPLSLSQSERDKPSLSSGSLSLSSRKNSSNSAFASLTPASPCGIEAEATVLSVTSLETASRDLPSLSIDRPRFSFACFFVIFCLSSNVISSAFSSPTSCSSGLSSLLCPS
mmetsp:Transcript_31007/g.54417  ORF Transcript_31007/g.54417 Transcript_31007/m.54417 type:complete len:280 (+) Transcript_31007:94-933(+)